MPRLTVRRRYAAMGTLMLVSVLYWLAAWVAIRAEIDRQDGSVPDLTAFVMELTAVYGATLGYLAMLLALHLLVAGLSWRRADREALLGTGMSALAHLAFLVVYGVLG